MGTHHQLTMKVLCILALGLVVVAADLSVDVTQELDRMASPEDRTIVCGFFSQLRCTSACAGQACTASCNADCGLGRTNTYTCSAIAASTCTGGTSSGTSSDVTITGGR